jgi:hypothetical protein
VNIIDAGMGTAVGATVGIDVGTTVGDFVGAAVGVVADVHAPSKIAKAIRIDRDLRNILDSPQEFLSHKQKAPCRSDKGLKSNGSIDQASGFHPLSARFVVKRSAGRRPGLVVR